MYQTTKVAFKYDSLWNLVDTYQVSYQYPDYAYTVPFEEIDNTQKRIAAEDKLQYTNHTITHTGFMDNHFLFSYGKPVREDQVTQADGFTREYVMHAINVDDGRQFDILLPKHLVGFKFQSLPGNRIAMTGKLDVESEDKYIFIFKIKFD